MVQRAIDLEQQRTLAFFDKILRPAIMQFCEESKMRMTWACFDDTGLICGASCDKSDPQLAHAIMELAESCGAVVGMIPLSVLADEIVVGEDEPAHKCDNCEAEDAHQVDENAYLCVPCDRLAHQVAKAEKAAGWDPNP